MDTTTTPTVELNLYQLVFKVLTPYEGTITLAAKDIDTAKEYAAKMFVEHKNYELINIFDINECPILKRQILEAKLALDKVPASSLN